MPKTYLLFRRTFWKYIPLKRYLIFSTAIFFLFSGIGFVSDLIGKGSFSKTMLLLNVLYSGLVAVFYVYSFTRNIKFLPFTILFQLIVGFYVWNAGSELMLNEFKKRAVFDAYGILITIVLGYVLIVIFLSREGIRNLRLQTEMKLAQDLHSNLVPGIDINNDYFQIYGISKPTEEVGGDLIDYIENKRTNVCYIADVSGHGVAAGSMMGMFKSTVRVLLNKDESLKSILNDTGKTIYDLKKKDMFITCAFLKFNSNNIVEYSTAGHLPILKLANNSGEFEELIIKQVPIAATNNFEYKTNSTKYYKGDLFILLTDGITETANNNKDDFGIERVKQIILNYRNDALSKIYENINKEITSFGKQMDDQTIMLIRCS